MTAQVRRDQGLQQEAQEFDSWRHQTHQPGPQQGYNPMSSITSDPYLSSFYAGSYHYPGFGVGDGTWSNGGDHMTFLGSYGGGMPAGTEGAVPQAYGTDLSQATMFNAGGGFGAFTQPGYGFDFHSTGPGYSQWGRTGEQYYRAEHYNPQHGEHLDRQQGRLPTAEQAMQGLTIASQQVEKEQVGHHQPKIERNDKAEVSVRHETNGQNVQSGSSGHNKKMSWANIASQPAKPPPPPAKTKKPGVLPPPVVGGPSKHNNSNMDIGTWDGAAQNGLPPPVITGPPPSGPPPKINGNMNVSRAPQGVSGPRGVKGPGPCFGVQPNGNLAAGPPPSPPSHPVLDELKSVNDYNPRDFDLNSKNARFFVVKSYSEDDIHRSIKYEIWCSTEHGNKRLDSAFREREARGPVFLFFSVNGSGHFCGMAQMLCGVDYSSSAGVWAQDKWKGQFKVKWIYVKDVPNSQLRHIRLENNENKPVTNSRDTQEVPPEKGRQVLKIIDSYKHATSIFDDFIHYEKRQEEDEGRKPPPGNKNPSQGRDSSRPHEGHYEGREERPRERRDNRRRDRDRDREQGEAREQNGGNTRDSREHSGEERRKEEKGQGRSRGNPSKK